MDFNNIEQHLRILNTVGYTLNVDERIKIELGLIKLSDGYPEIEQFKFWGRIETLTKSYYIVIGLKYSKCYEFPHKTFFWSSSNFVFAELPDIFIQHKDVVNKHKSLFTGDPNKILVSFEGEGGSQQQPPAEQNKQQGSPEKKVVKIQDDDEIIELPKKNFTELNRLSFIVRSIENDCHVVPLGAYKMSPSHQLHPNLNFHGLHKNEANSESKWQHFRAPQSEEKKKQIQKQNVIFRNDFLDKLGNDKPHGCWCIQSDYTNTNYTVRNLIWPGYYAYHKINTGLFGSVYIGDGLKNSDLAFLL